MNKYVSDAIGGIDDRHVREVMVFRKEKEDLNMKKTNKRARAFVKWGAMAACLMLVVMAGVIFGRDRMGETPPIVSNMIERNYKDGITPKELMLEWPWAYKTTSEKYTHLTVDGTVYYAVFQKLDAESLGSRIGMFEAKGWDSYEDEKEYRTDFEVYEIKAMPTSACVAVKIDEGYEIYATDEGRGMLKAPETYMLVGNVIEIGDGYVIIDDTEVCEDSKDGRRFTVLTSDLRVSRCFEFRGFDVREGDLVVVLFDAPIAVGEDGTVSGAVDLKHGYLLEQGDIAIPE